ncbi:sirohydrochlorin chelatase [Agromyces cerinus]|uniref:Sirohydrochlorin ferrochelatase n=1 Tax=Agromyces cerinus subsp. cerinus TaxID=232089 RepID=A0A1N6DMF8_9MICO|nr:CbiX/SirB N-terminal domain-containing protein [Agromyces cerinus]SIN71907.1 Sirohydrochlorin ferrochelatase [Agromyces cerinus subsp. cerinus]
MVGSRGAGAPAEHVEAHPLRLVAVTHGAPSSANREAVIRLVDGVASARPELDVSISFVDASRSDVAAALGPDDDAGAVIVPLVLSAGFHVRTGLSLGLDRRGSDAGALTGTRLAAELGPDDRIVEVLAERLDRLRLSDTDAVVLAAAGSNDPRAVRECFETARRLGHRLGRSVTVGFIAAAIPRLHDAIEMIREVHPGVRVVVGSYLLAPGTFYDAAASAGADAIASPLLLPDEAAPGQLVDLVLDRYSDIAAPRLERA